MTPIPFDVLGPFQTTRIAAAKPVEHSSVPRSPFGPRLVAEIDYVAYWARALEVPVSKFIMIYKGPAADMSKVTEEQGKAVMEQWNKWMKKVGPALVDFGAPFGQGTSIVDNGSEKKAARLTGYTIVEAKSLAGAKRLTKGHPFLSQVSGEKR